MTRSRAPRADRLRGVGLAASAAVVIGSAALESVGWLPAGLALALWLLPGLLLTLASGRVRDAASFVLLSFLVSYVVHAGLLTGAKLAFGQPLARWYYEELVLGVSGLCVLVCGARVWRAGEGFAFPWSVRADRIQLATWLVLLIVGTLFLTTWFGAVDLDDDGAEARFLAHSLSRYMLPRWPTNTGLVGLGVGLFSQAFPVHFLTYWTGDLELGPRLPLALGLPVIAAGLAGLVEHGAERRASAAVRYGLVVVVAIVGLLLASSAGYGAYWAEPASPGGFDVLFLAFTVGALWALVEGRGFALLLFVLLAHLARPTGVLVFALLLVAALVAGGAQRRAWATRLAGCVALCLVVLLLHEKVYTPWVLGESVLGYDSRSALARYRYLTLTDVRRIAWMVVPSGIVPALSLFAWRRLDPLSRVLALFLGAYALAFYVPAFVCLHHYAPAMLLPVVVYGRLAVRGGIGHGTHLAWFGGLALAAWLAWPAQLGEHRELSRLGRRILDRREEAPPFAPDPRARSRVLEPLVHLQLPGEDPSETWVGSAWSLSHYVRRGQEIPRSVDWLVQRVSDAVPSGWVRIGAHGEDALLARSGREDERPRPPAPGYAAPLFAIEREVLFRHLGVPAGRYDVDLRDWIPYGEER